MGSVDTSNKKPFRRRRLFYIDPQSYNNLSVYDTCLMEGIKGYDVTYFHNVRYQCVPLDGVEYRSVFSYSDKSGALKALSYLFSIIAVAVAVCVQRPDVVHIQWFRWFPIDNLLVRWLRLWGVKVVHTAHNILPHNPSAADTKHYAWYYRNADAIIVHTQRSKDELIDAFGEDAAKIHVVPHGILPSTVSDADVQVRMKELREKLHTDGRMVFASMGFQNYYKGIDIIADVWMNCRELNDNPECVLLVVGKVENADVTALKNGKNVVVVDEMTSDIDFDAYLRLADVALLPYRSISQSGVLLTAIQRGVPVAVADVGGLTDPLRYGKVGWCMGEANAANLQKILLHLLENPHEVKACREDEQAFRKVREAYSWQQIGATTSCIYEALVRGAK